MDETLAPIAPPNFSRAKRNRKSVAVPQHKQLILLAVHEFRRVRGYSPTYKELAVLIGYKKTSSGIVHSYCDQLIADGWLTTDPNLTSRNILPTHASEDVYCAITDPDLKKIARLQRNLKLLR